jgi:hypothetical protein
MPDPVASPFAALSLIVAPAILTNASSVLAMSTSNRLARAVDRGRDLARQLEDGARPDDDGRRLNELSVTENRAILLVRALRSFYTALGAFAVATLVSLVGAVAATAAGGVGVKTLEVVALIAGAFAVAGLAMAPCCCCAKRAWPWTSCASGRGCSAATALVRPEGLHIARFTVLPSRFETIQGALFRFAATSAELRR